MCSNVLLHSSFKKHFVLASSTHQRLNIPSATFNHVRQIHGVLALAFVCWDHVTPPPPARYTEYHTDHTIKQTFTFIPSHYPIPLQSGTTPLTSRLSFHEYTSQSCVLTLCITRCPVRMQLFSQTEQSISSKAGLP